MWTDSATGEQFVINSRTGNSFCQTGKRHGEDKKTEFATHEAGRRTLRQQETKNAALGSTELGEKKLPMWLEKALEVCLVPSCPCFGSADHSFDNRAIEHTPWLKVESPL